MYLLCIYTTLSLGKAFKDFKDYHLMFFFKVYLTTYTSTHKD